MRTEVHNGPSPPSVTALVSGILADVRDLAVQQTRLVREEVREDMTKARAGAIFLGVGLVLAPIGALQLCLMLPHLLNWAAPEVPLWACYGIFGIVFLLFGGGFAVVALQRFKKAASMRESATALKENVQCLLKPR